MRLLAVLTMSLALLATFLSAPAASAGVETPTAGLTFQVYTCPVDYAGEEYLTDCTAGPASYELTVNGDGPFVSGETSADGFYALNYPLGETVVGLQVSPDSNDFYLACFDTTSGSEVFLFDGTVNSLTLDTSTGGSFSCRWYVIPSSAGEPAPTTADGTFQVYDCELDYTGDADAAGCVAAPSGIPVRISGDGGDYVQNTQTSQSGTALDSTIPPGAITVTLDIEEVVYPRGSTGFEVECFDTTSGTAESLGTTNVGTFDLAVVAGGTYACDFYVTPQSAAGTANAAFQVFECPVEYVGDDYLDDCAPVDPARSVDVLLVAGPEFDIENDPLTGTTGDDGRTLFEALPAGTYSAALDLSERVNSFYYACFDVTSGTEEFLFDGGGVQLTADIAAGGLLSCRWYVIPADLEDGTSASPSASSVPSASATASGSGTSSGSVTGLPSTGTGSSMGTSVTGAALVVAMLALTAVAFATRRLISARR